MKSNNDLVKEWFKKAEEDILNIENNLKAENIPLGSVCFHAQQAAEKYLKGYLIYCEIEFEFVHDLIYLCDLAIQKDKEFEKLKKMFKKLNKYAVEIRYPYYYTPALEEVKESFSMAKEIKDFILQKIKL